MILSNQILDDDLISEEEIVIQNARSLLEEKFNIEGFGQIIIHRKNTIIRETAALKRVWLEDKGIPNSYWLRTKKEGLISGDIDPDKLIVIASLDLDDNY